MKKPRFFLLFLASYYVNAIGSCAGENITKFIINSISTLAYLNLRHNQLGDITITDIVSCLCKSNIIKTLEIGSNNIGVEAMGAIAKLLQKNTSLKHLALDWNCIGAKALAVIKEPLQNNTNLFALDLRWNKLFDAGWQTRNDNSSTNLKQNPQFAITKFI